MSKKVKFKVGDKVKLVSNASGSYNEVGTVGEVIEVLKRKGTYPLYAVKGDGDTDYRPNTVGSNINSGYYSRAEDLEFVSEEPDIYDAQFADVDITVNNQSRKVTLAAIRIHNGNVNVGVTVLNPKDKYDRNLSAKISFGRAVKKPVYTTDKWEISDYEELLRYVGVGIALGDFEVGGFH